MTHDRRTELTRLAALPPESPDLGQALRDRLDLIAAVQELLLDVVRLEAVVEHLKASQPAEMRMREMRPKTKRN